MEFIRQKFTEQLVNIFYSGNYDINLIAYYSDIHEQTLNKLFLDKNAKDNNLENYNHRKQIKIGTLIKINKAMTVIQALNKAAA